MYIILQTGLHNLYLQPVAKKDQCELLQFLEKQNFPATALSTFVGYSLTHDYRSNENLAVRSIMQFREQHT